MDNDKPKESTTFRVNTVRGTLVWVTKTKRGRFMLTKLNGDNKTMTWSEACDWINDN